MGRPGVAPQLEAVPAPRGGHGQEDREAVGVHARFRLAAVEQQAAGEAAVLGRLEGVGVIEQELHRRGDAGVAPGQVLRPVDVVGGRGRRDEAADRAAVRRVGDVAVLVVVDGEAVAGAVDALEPVERGGEARELVELDEVGVGRAGLGRGKVDRVRVIGEAGGLEQPGMDSPEAARAGGAGGAAHHGGGAAAQLTVARVHAVQGADELHGLRGAEVAGQPVGRVAAGAAALATRVEVAENDRVACVAAGAEGLPGRVDQAAVDHRRDRDGRALDRLRREVGAEVGLVPELPPAHSGQPLVLAAVAGADRLNELPVLRGRGLPGGIAAVPRLARAGGPPRRRTGERQVERDAERLGLPDDRVVRRPAAGRVGGRVARVEASRRIRREGRRRDAVPGHGQPDHAGAKLAQGRERARGVGQQMDVLLEHRHRATGSCRGRGSGSDDGRGHADGADQGRDQSADGDEHCKSKQMV